MKKAISKNSNRNDLIRDTLMQGCNLGIILLTSSMFLFCITGNRKGLELLIPNFLPFLLCYMAAGSLIQALRHLPETNFRWLRGITAMYFLFLFSILIFNADLFIPAHIYHMLLINLCVLIGLWAVDYRYLTRIANELNLSSRSKCLIVDLKEKPKSQEEFFQILEQYCSKNHLSLSYMKREIPAIVELDGVRHRIELNYYYSFGGPIYTMDIITD